MTFAVIISNSNSSEKGCSHKSKDKGKGIRIVQETAKVLNQQH